MNSTNGNKRMLDEGADATNEEAISVKLAKTCEQLNTQLAENALLLTKIKDLTSRISQNQTPPAPDHVPPVQAPVQPQKITMMQRMLATTPDQRRRINLIQQGQTRHVFPRDKAVIIAEILKEQKDEDVKQKIMSVNPDQRRRIQAELKEVQPNKTVIVAILNENSMQ